MFFFMMAFALIGFFGGGAIAFPNNSSVNSTQHWMGFSIMIISILIIAIPVGIKYIKGDYDD